MRNQPIASCASDGDIVIDVILNVGYPKGRKRIASAFWIGHFPAVGSVYHFPVAGFLAKCFRSVGRQYDTGTNEHGEIALHLIGHFVAIFQEKTVTNGVEANIVNSARTIGGVDSDETTERSVDGVRFEVCRILILIYYKL